MGTRVVRVEDPRLLTAGGTYTDDLREPLLTGAAYATFVRSPHAHARITGIDVSAAQDEPGVVAVLTGQDAAAELPAPPDNPNAEPLLATDTVRYVGEPVALVVTDGRYQGEDAAELVSVDYEPLPAVIDIDDALRGETLLFPESGSNVVASGGGDGSGDDAFADCEVVVERTIVNQRVAPAPLETRAAAAAWADERLTVWVSTQNAHWARDAIAGALGLEPAAVRVITPDVGGGFGAKIGADRDGIAVAWAARRTGRPVRWVETRSENLVGMTHGRGQRHAIKIGGTRDGRITAYRLGVIQDAGGYPRMATLLATLTQTMASGVYDIPHVEAGFQVVVTNTTPVAAYRGAGRPEATAAVERAVDMFAAEIGMDPAEVRRRNFIAPDKFPYTTPGGMEYDTGEYAAALDRVLSAAGYDELRAEQARRREQGGPVQLGVGLSTYVEITGGVPEIGETARLEVHDDGTVTVLTGSSPHGQGHATAWAMLVQDELGIPMDKITVRHGDTDAIPVGIGTFGSRSLQLGGTAVHQAAVNVKERARELAADELEADKADLEFDVAGGVWRVRGTPDIGLDWGRLARLAGPDGLAADVHFTSPKSTFPFGAHVAVVEADVETGKVRLVRHVTVDDAGPVLNPVLAEGQRQGGIAQGAAQALLEEVLYDSDGNPVTSTLVDYPFITATELPSFELVDMATPTPLNPLGVKGIGEAGTIGATPAVQNAVVDAVAHLGVRHIDMPTTPQRVWTAINEARAGQ
ncbi:MAG TPA: xanthine dehydrogenase family protein molybdopterin-binding subunit [Streptosporangiaceae bacterium]|nr:xanthine dehydrogenase family protein molybdopterin-binding subunit [Streptosporangiaceae bacterium]